MYVYGYIYKYIYRTYSYMLYMDTNLMDEGQQVILYRPGHNLNDVMDGHLQLLQIDDVCHHCGEDVCSAIQMTAGLVGPGDEELAII